MKTLYSLIANCMPLVLTGVLAAQTAPKEPSTPTPVQNAADAMAASLARQRVAVQRQIGASELGSFFVLPPPSAMGANYPASAAAAPAPVTAPGDCDPLPSTRVDALVADAARNTGIDGVLLRSVMQQESGFRPCAVSPKGAMGLMQLMPATANQFGVADPFNPADNVEAGAKFLQELMTRYSGDLSRVLGAYNAGPARVDDAGGVPNIPETIDYIRRIMALLPVSPIH